MALKLLRGGCKWWLQERTWTVRFILQAAVRWQESHVGHHRRSEKNGSNTEEQCGVSQGICVDRLLGASGLECEEDLPTETKNQVSLDRVRREEDRIKRLQDNDKMDEKNIF
jgi:hypothetical protein